MVIFVKSIAMKYVQLLAAAIFGLWSAATAQTPATVTVKGKIVSSRTKEPVAAATISLIPAGGQGKPQSLTAEASGTFSAQVLPGVYQLKIEAVNCKELLLPATLISRDTLLNSIQLEENAKQLGNVTVVATKSDIELKTDKKVFNVGKDILSKGGNATDVLNNVPSVNVDPMGNISLRGNGNVRILINGKPSMLTTSDGIRQISAASIEKIEVITNPSSAYEAQGSAGIINIVLRKNSQYGFNASLQGSMGSPSNNSINANVSYKTKKVNIFSNIGYRYVKSFSNEDIYRQNRGGNESVLQQRNGYKASNGNTNFYIGGDYYINDKNTLTGSYYYARRDNKDTGRYNYNYFNKYGQMDSSITRSEDYREPQIFNELELNYVRTFKKPGRKWTTNLQYDFWNDDENQRIGQQKVHPGTGTALDMVTRDIESSDDIFIQSDYVTPVGKEGRLETGVRGDLRAIRSEYSASLNGVSQSEYDNKLFYDENIYGAYVQYGSKLKKLSYLLGVRAEFSNIKIADRKNTVDKEKNYINFFPTMHLQYSMKNELELQLSYSRRINRPRFWQLNSFAGLSDTRNLRVGNPDLDPMYTNSFELGVLKKAGKLTINPGVYYQYSTGYFDFIQQQTPDGYFISTPLNLGTEKRFGAELSTIYNPFKWWRLSMDINFYQFSQDGAYQGKTYEVSDKTWFGTIRSGIKFPKVVSVDLSFNYRARNKNVQAVTRPQYRANLALSKDFFQDKLSLILAINNLLNSQESRQTVDAPGYYFDDFFKRQGPQLMCTVVYRFNRKKGQADRMPREK